MRAARPGFGTLGDYVFLSPTKLGGGAHAQDLQTGKTMAWIEYWNYGDPCPIAHHLAAYPSADPRKGFEFVNSTQGGANVLIYGLPTEIKERGLLDPVWGQGNHLYRVHYDGQQMNLIEDVAETTGIGLGVHTVIYPDATGFAAADGQKDVAAFFDRPPLPTLAKDDVAVSEINKGQKTKVQMAFSADWIGREFDRLDGSQLVQRREAAHHRAWSRRAKPASTTCAATRATRSTGKWCRWRSTSCTRASFPAMRRASSAASTRWSTIPATATRRW